ncbi:MAG TPA: ArsC/Spx/MgsR family protein [Bryobacteraceae bacterium]|nr:ArsC/Spx/MgsR family protein [Bryobacteraceae bacterium]
MPNIQIFGVRNSQETRAAERFFKERGVKFHFVDLKVRPMAPGEIHRFTEYFGLDSLLDKESAGYADAGLKYLKTNESELLARIERQPKLLKLPLIRSGNKLSIGRNEEAWKQMLED